MFENKDDLHPSVNQCHNPISRIHAAHIRWKSKNLIQPKYATNTSFRKVVSNPNSWNKSVVSNNFRISLYLKLARNSGADAFRRFPSTCRSQSRLNSPSHPSTPAALCSSSRASCPSMLVLRVAASMLIGHHWPAGIGHRRPENNAFNAFVEDFEHFGTFRDGFYRLSDAFSFPRNL